MQKPTPFEFFTEPAPFYLEANVADIIPPAEQEISKQLRDKVKEYGRIIVPVVLQWHGNKLMIHEGRKRIQLCIEYNIQTVPALVYNEEDAVPENLGTVLNETHKGNRNQTLHAVFRLYMEEGMSVPDIARELGITTQRAKKYVDDIQAHPQIVTALFSKQLSQTLFQKVARRPLDEQMAVAALLEAKGKINEEDIKTVQREAAKRRDAAKPGLFTLPEFSLPYVLSAESRGDGVKGKLLRDGVEVEYTIPIDKILEFTQIQEAA